MHCGGSVRRNRTKWELWSLSQSFLLLFNFDAGQVFFFLSVCVCARTDMIRCFELFAQKELYKRA